MWKQEYFEDIMTNFEEWTGPKVDDFMGQEMETNPFREQMYEIAKKEGFDKAKQYLIDINFDKKTIKEILYFIKQKQKMETKNIPIKDLGNNNKWPVKVPVRVIKIPNASAGKTDSPKVYKRKQKKTLKQMLIIALVLSTILFLLLWIVYASEPNAPKYNDSICNTDKCKARVARLNTCNTEWNDNVVACATKLTLTASEKIVRNELSLLEERASREGVSWKQTAIDMTISHESFSPTAYCDKLEPFTRANWTKGLKKACYTWKERYSIWYWTISYKWAPAITKAEATRRMHDVFASTFFPVVEKTTCWTDNQKSAIADFAYNSGAGRLHNITQIPFSYYVSSCNYKQVLGFMDYWLYSGGVIDRKKAERELFLK